MKYSILHISDIHKSPRVQYNSLLDSLERDLVYYTESENIEKPSFIVISGDIIQGATNDNEIRQQYTDVEEFLSNLCNLFLDGDKKRMIIVPGNHDVNRTRTIASMSPSIESADEDCKKYFQGSSSVRWNWKDFKFYNIVDPVTYDSRFELFVEFYNRFFNGIRQYPEHPVTEAYCVRDDEHKVTFACFNSCHQLDHLCVTGCIPEEAIYSIGQELFDSYKSGYLNIAVWHHHFYGSPLTTNYMDRAFLNYMLEHNVQLGLFGHQHLSQIAEEYSDLQLSKEEKIKRMLLVSSGTLFGGEKELQPEIKRQYNIIEVEHENGSAKISINIREDGNPYKNNLIPFWHCKALQTNDNKLHRTLELKTVSDNKKLLEIDRKVKEDNNYKAACESILQLNINEDMKHSIWLRYLKEVRDDEYVFNALKNVNSVEEGVLKIISALNIGDKTKFQEVLDNDFIKTSEDSNIKALLSELTKQTVL